MRRLCRKVLGFVEGGKNEVVEIGAVPAELSPEKNARACPVRAEEAAEKAATLFVRVKAQGVAQRSEVDCCECRSLSGRNVHALSVRADRPAGQAAVIGRSRAVLERRY